MNPRLKNRFGMVSNEVSRDPDLCLRAKGLYSYLTTYADGNNELYVGIDKIAAECGINQSSVKRILNDLKTAGVIKREKRGKNQSYKTILLK